jgi:hypothetical protein
MRPANATAGLVRSRRGLGAANTPGRAENPARSDLDGAIIRSRTLTLPYCIRTTFGTLRVRHTDIAVVPANAPGRPRVNGWCRQGVPEQVRDDGVRSS